MIDDLIRKNRSFRRFDEKVAIEESTLRELVNLARQSASAANLQPLKYIPSWQRQTNEIIFPNLAWAGYLKDFPGPAAGERPTAYIIILGDNTITQNFHCDHGIACQSILLGAVERGLGGCIIGSIDREKLRKQLAIPEHLQILLVIALGRPAEKVILEEVGPDGSIKYWRDDQDRHHVPKRPLDEIILKLK